MNQDMDALRYPVGKFQKPEKRSAKNIAEWISEIENFPAKLKKETEGLSEKDLEKTYRPGGWNIRQVVHHCADSHMNAIIRFKLALTEDNLTIKPYKENLWAELPDTRLALISLSIQLLEPLHARWILVLKNMNESDFSRTYIHPEHNRIVSLYDALATYAWHCRHHLAHIILAKKQV